MKNCPVCGIEQIYTFQRCDCVIPEEKAVVEEVVEKVEKPKMKATPKKKAAKKA